MRCTSSGPFRGLATGIAIAGALALAGCSGGGGGAVAPASATPDTGIAAIDAVQSAIGGTWSGIVELPHTACVVGDEPKPGDGMQSVRSTSSPAARSEDDALRAAELAAEALSGIGATTGDVSQADDIATVSAVDEYASSMTVTVTTEQAYIEYRSTCSGGNETT
ncbi:hypothetical protein GCM10011490_17770 [Pseudoclavibacter endophyticus]|uniref:Uncharacterized protein n=1 Tax=Pseudoclavibacter endophyticus TaxID=1778590 RepID=A0A6H9WD40_9MICO|nr:hypothetical protein [Pseudoclavibacter endophyticus]KAB1648872.1 hypothetical protein F8O04_00780 [Pseudoclavibacter endophyticus]GGA67625.1 hypothetical protein GCM10011490_17770 [Pseudoclavibacter endophyticus]